jgi:hypothetical protein
LINADFEVPAGTRGGTVTVTPTGAATALGGPEREQPVSYRPQPPSGTVTVALPS